MLWRGCVCVRRRERGRERGAGGCVCLPVEDTLGGTRGRDVERQCMDMYLQKSRVYVSVSVSVYVSVYVVLVHVILSERDRERDGDGVPCSCSLPLWCCCPDVFAHVSMCSL